MYRYLKCNPENSFKTVFSGSRAICSGIEQVKIKAQDCAFKEIVMLTKSVLNTLQEVAGLATFSKPVPSNQLPVSKAANANRFDPHAALVRRNRRMRRAERNTPRSMGGWTVRMW
jgi:hypothetical protein